ncbi:zinc finger MYM-type protein 1-like [Metopolophium dirhodum]|uniref:zinc finger MYM-type protein 1-like n=1 Tax=Metopolophium dirhodum TaxID=44670 RepID=UPI00299070DB|nr:zinc finger MYM-type protein 1-like [Metopolophium dirhodum]
MRGRYNGLQQLIRNENPQAIFIWCFSHRLNLIVADAVSVCSNAMDLFRNLERLYDFISSSKFRADVYEEQQKKHYHGQQIRRLKRVSCTRWMSHKFALDVVLNTYVATVECLNVIRSESGDKKAGSEAGGFLNYFQSTRFVYTAYSFKVLLQILELVSSLLQKTDFDLLAASFLIKKKYEEIVSYRSEESFKIILAESEAFMDSMQNIEFQPLLSYRKTC